MNELVHHNYSKIIIILFGSAEGMSQTEKVLLLMSNVHEGVRVANSRTDNQSIPVYPFSKHTYRKEPGHFYSKVYMYKTQ